MKHIVKMSDVIDIIKNKEIDRIVFLLKKSIAYCPNCKSNFCNATNLLCGARCSCGEKLILQRVKKLYSYWNYKMRIIDENKIGGIIDGREEFIELSNIIYFNLNGAKTCKQLNEEYFVI